VVGGHPISEGLWGAMRRTTSSPPSRCDHAAWPLVQSLLCGRYAGLEFSCYHSHFIAPPAVPTFVSVVEVAGWWDVVDVVAPKLIGAALRDQVWSLNGGEARCTCMRHQLGLW
jgi:hypothetical protein